MPNYTNNLINVGKTNLMVGIFPLFPVDSTRKKYIEEDLGPPGVAGVVAPSNFFGDATSSFKEDLWTQMKNI
jgi:hypothetical protein